MIDPKVSSTITNIQSDVGRALTRLYSSASRNADAKELREAIDFAKHELASAIDDIVSMEEEIMFSAYDESCNKALLTMAFAIQDFCDVMISANYYTATKGNYAWTPSLMVRPDANVQLQGAGNSNIEQFIYGVKLMLGKDPSKRLELPAEYNEDGDYD